MQGAVVSTKEMVHRVPGAIQVSSTQELGIDDLKVAVLTSLSAQPKALKEVPLG